MPTSPRVQHVSLPRPRGSDDQARRFYGELLGLQEIAPPTSLADLQLIWFRLGDTELHLFLGEEVPERAAAHVCLAVDDLAGLRSRLETGGVGILPDTPIPNRPRFFVRDPFANLIELTTILGSYN